MAQVVVMIQNRLGEAYEAIDALADRGTLVPADSCALKALYATGWEDGFVAGCFEDLSERYGFSTAEFLTSMTRLENAGAIRLRPLESGECSIELVTLCCTSDSSRLGWWRYFIVDVEDDAA